MASPFGDKGWIEPARTRVFINRGAGAGMIAPYDRVDPFDLPVHMASAGETAASFNRFTDRARAGGDWLIFLFHTISPTVANWYNPVDVAEVGRCMTYPRSLGDVWVDTLGADARCGSRMPDAAGLRRRRANTPEPGWECG